MRMLNHALDIFTLTSIGNAIHEHVLTTTIAEPKTSDGDAIIQNCHSCCLRAIGKCKIQLRIRNPLKWNDYISIWAFFAHMTKNKHNKLSKLIQEILLKDDTDPIW